MNVVEVTVSRLAIPMKLSFRHALAERSTSDSVLAIARDGSGNEGLGESAPRPYVTGESPESVREALERRWIPAVLGRSFADLEELRAELERLGGDVPREELAAFCALELALLDLAGRAFERSAGALLGELRRDRVAYSGIVSADAAPRAAQTCRMLQEHGVSAVKAKVGRSLEEDLELLGVVRDVLGDAPSLRVDANCAWDAATAVKRMAAFERFRIDAVEQPCAADALEESATVRRESGVPVVLDESLASIDDAHRIVDAQACDVFNLRVSKCGGLLLTQRLREVAREADLACMLGAQVGETAILSAAGRQLATRGDELRFAEGSYGTLLLEADVSDDTALGCGATGGALEGPGLGLRADLGRIAPYLSDERRATA